ncbi:hypothetical protein B0H14DRAFT_2627375 [Mycena olivaceomarginata]|nr:hypothetical protein B0H14DRAFT_2627375 [Mycena olivaceomarginata]
MSRRQNTLQYLDTYAADDDDMVESDGYEVPNSYKAQPPPMSGSHASTPLRAPTPPGFRAQMPLFLPDSRGPTLYAFDLRGPTPQLLEAPRFFTPLSLGPTMQGRSPSPPTSSQPPAKCQHTQDEQGENEDEEDDEASDQEEDEDKLLCLFRRPMKFVNHRLQQLLDLAAAADDNDDDTDGEDDDNNEDVEELQRNFLDDWEQPDNTVIRVHLVDAHEHKRGHAEALCLAAHYDEAAAEFYWREDRPCAAQSPAERRDLDSSGDEHNASYGGLHYHNVFLPRAEVGREKHHPKTGDPGSR